MKELSNYICDEITSVAITHDAIIAEAIKIGSSADHISVYSCQPRTKNELIYIIEERIAKEGPNCDLNDIDVSKITDMSYLFHRSKFNGDISKWDVSKVKRMSWMFSYSDFNGDISEWNVSNVEYMGYIFHKSAFNNENGDISKWDVSKVEDMRFMFHDAKINHETLNWKIGRNWKVIKN